MFADFLNLRTRKYFNKLLSEEKGKDFIWTNENVYIWNDMNEPKCKEIEELTFPKNTIHTLSLKEGEEVKVEHRLVHNVYGYFNALSTCQALLERGKGRIKPFWLTRSFWAGS